MITLEKPYSVRKSGIENDGISFGIKKEGLAHIFNVLRNQLYSNKILAVIREYSCNAYDAQVEAGTSDQKFIVTCPTLDDPSFKVRDFGSGLSPEGIAEVYAYYGESTKRNSNALIGQLGLGSKSGFAYGDNFVIRSFYQGTLYTYNAYLDETKIGQILKMSEEPTSEKDGVEIVIPVKIRDISTFKETIANFFKHFKSKPIINNIDEVYLNVYWKTEDQVLTGEGWKFLKARNSWDKAPSLMVMGNVAYPLDGNSVDNLQSVFHSDFIVEFNIGELEVSASRESLQFSTATQNAIRKRFKAIMAEISQKISDKIANAKSLFEAKCIYNSLSNSSGDFYRFQKQFANITWNGIKIDNDTITASNSTNKEVRIFEIVSSRKSERVISRIVENKTIRCYSWCRLYVDDTNQKFMQRLGHYVYDHKTSGVSTIFVIQFSSDKAKKDWFSEVGMAESEIPLASSEKICKIEYPKNTNGASLSVRDTKHLTSEFKLNLSATGGWYKVKSDQFSEASFDLDKGGVYIHINRFHCKSYFDPNNPECLIEPSKFIKLLNFSEKGFDIVYPEVACFKEDTAEKASKNKNWQSLKEYVKDYISKAWTNGQCQKIVNYIELQSFLSDYGREWNLIKQIKNIDSITKFQKIVESFYLIQAYGVLNKDASDNLIEVFKRVSLKETICGGLSPTHSLKKEMKDILDKYEIFGAVDWWEAKSPKIVQKYIELEEKSLTTAPIAQ